MMIIISPMMFPSFIKSFIIFYIILTRIEIGAIRLKLFRTMFTLIMLS